MAKFLAFLTLVIASVAADRFWARHSLEGVSDVEALKLAFDIRLILNGMIIGVLDEKALLKVPSTAKMAPYNENQKVIALFGENANTYLKTSLFATQNFVLAADVPENELSAIPETIQVVTLPKRAIRPLKARKFPVSVKNEAIEALVENVDIDNIENVLDHLSNSYTTRQSGSTGAVAAGSWIANEFSSLGLEVITFKHRADHSNNVCGRLQGTSNSLVITGAHYDCRNANSGDTTGRAPGADDNGSGTATILEIARGIVASGLNFRYSLQFCVWSGEEQGLLGSRYYAADLADNNTDVVAYLNADMVGFNPNGAGSPPVITFMSGSASRTLNNFLEEIANQYVPGVEVSRTNACCSDQQSFYENGYEAAGYFEHDLSSGAGAYSCYHRECDTIANIDFEQVEVFAKAIIAGFATLAEPL